MIRQFQAHGWTAEEVEAAIGEAAFDSVAATADHCETEPDGTCDHGYPSVLRAFGLV